MNELDQAIARLKDLGATAQEIQAYTQAYMLAHGSRPDATRALQREREHPTGDWEAIPDEIKTAAEVGLAIIPAERPAMAAAQGLRRIAPVARAVAAELPGLRGIVRGARAGQRVWSASKAMERVVPKAEGLIGPEASIANEPVTLAPRRIQSARERLAQMAGIDNLVDAERAVNRQAVAPRRTVLERLDELRAEPKADAGQPWKPQRAKGATQERDAYWQNRLAATRTAEQEAAASATEPPIEDLLRLNLEHIKKGGSMKSAADALRLVRRP